MLPIAVAVILATPRVVRSTSISITTLTLSVSSQRLRRLTNLLQQAGSAFLVRYIYFRHYFPLSYVPSAVLAMPYLSTLSVSCQILTWGT